MNGNHPFPSCPVLKTADQSNWHFALNDWVGTKRVTTKSDGTKWTSIFSGPFGDYQSQTGPGTDPSAHHFTSKERDIQSNLDYFTARDYNSNGGRFMSPDEPFANFDQKDPQSFNMYSYVQNNPLSATDPDGHNVRLCADNGNGGQNCVNLTDDQYKQLYQQQNGQQGINLPGGSMPNGSITCGGQTCGTAQFYEPGLHDETGDILGGLAGGKIGGYLLGKAASFVGGLFGGGASEGGGVVLGRTFELGDEALGAGERKLNLPDLGDPKANWAQNSSRLREAMAEGKPIRDAHVDGAGNMIRDNPLQGGGGAFLKAERNLLENHGWTYDPGTTSWNPPNR
jgi:RHS repeat-associated protein